MVSSSAIELEGAEEASARLVEMGNSLTTNIGSALREAADAFMSHAQSNAPVDTGFMRDHILTTDFSGTSVTITSEAGYSGFVEYGTRKMNSQPFFEPAIEQATPEIERLIVNAISGNI